MFDLFSIRYLDLRNIKQKFDNLSLIKLPIDGATVHAIHLSKRFDCIRSNKLLR